MFHLSQHMINDAREMLDKQPDIMLPKEIPSMPHFFIAESGDKTIQAFGGLSFAGKTFKIGTKKTDVR